MSKLLIKLNGAEADEVEEIRHLLDSHNIDYYETGSGFWGTALAGVWLRDDEQLAHAQQLLHGYHQERQQRVQAEYASLLSSGSHDTFLRRFLRQPFMVLIYLLAILAVLYFLVLPFILFMLH